MADTDSQVTSFSFSCDGVSAQLLVSEWRGEEGISRPYRFEVLLATTSHEDLTAQLTGAGARLQLFDASGTERVYNGLLFEVEQRDADSQYVYYHVVLMPRLMALASCRMSDVYLNLDLAGLIAQVIQRSGVASIGYRVSLTSSALTTTPLNFVCQYEETCLDFLARRLAHAGAYYYFEQGGSTETVVFISGEAGQAGTLAKLLYRPISSLAAEKSANGGGALEHLRVCTKAVPKSVTVRDFAASHAALQLDISEPVSGGTLGEVEYFGEHFDTQALGQAFAQVRAQALACRQRRLTGSSRAIGVSAGSSIEVSAHPVSTCNGSFYVLEVSHRGGQPLPARVAGDGVDFDEYHNTFVMLEAGIPFRSDRPEPRTIDHLVTGHIDGEAGDQYAQLDENGCYKVIFPFASTQGAAMSNSAWIRLATPSAGAKQGMHVPLLAGTEVIVQFLNGDPDRPVITAAMVNSESPNVVTNANATQNALKTAGGNAMVMEDREGAQQIALTSPTATSAITIGAGNAPGLALTSTHHAHVGSTSFTQVVNGMYSRTIGGNGVLAATAAPGPAPASPTAATPAATSGGSSSGGTSSAGAGMGSASAWMPNAGMTTNTVLDLFLVPSITYYATNYTQLVSGVQITGVAGIDIQLALSFTIEYKKSHSWYSNSKAETTAEREMTFGTMQMSGMSLYCETATAVHSATGSLKLLNGGNQLSLDTGAASLTAGQMGLILTPVAPVGDGIDAAGSALDAAGSAFSVAGIAGGMTMNASGDAASAASSDGAAATADEASEVAEEAAAEVTSGANVQLTGIDMMITATTQLNLAAPLIEAEGANGSFDFDEGFELMCGADIELEADGDIALGALGCIDLSAPLISLG
ncbi:type VI secretion system Vgr family protein [Paraburkholderia sediminicola]|uniref:type VI secretion system Vgr family protein n=1 Tax=Paraburkholderia sediminicola TaxID=458836 RepID=UPI0038B84327